MARPIKVGLDYFSLDVTLDDNVELMEAECGLQGFAVLIKIWQKIYSEGYYIEWKEDNAILFSRKINSELTLVNSVITSCLSRGIFSNELYTKYKILTSKAIQKRYLMVCKQLKRTNVSFINEYLLVNSELTQVISELTSINSEFSTQKKRKEKKGNEMKGNEEINTPEETDIDNKAIDLCKYYSTLKPGESITSQLSTLKIWIEDYGFDWTKEAIQMCAKSKNKFIVPWIDTVLKNWQSEGKEEVKSGSTGKDNAEGQGKFSGFKPPPPKCEGDIDTSDVI